MWEPDLLSPLKPVVVTPQDVWMDFAEPRVQPAAPPALGGGHWDLLPKPPPAPLPVAPGTGQNLQHQGLGATGVGLGGDI